MNPGNFRAILQLLGENNLKSNDHLDCPEMKNAKLTSPRIQNEVLELLTQHYIVLRLAEEIRIAKYYSIMADEVIAYNIGVVDSRNDIR